MYLEGVTYECSKKFPRQVFFNSSDEVNPFIEFSTGYVSGSKKNKSLLSFKGQEKDLSYRQGFFVGYIRQRILKDSIKNWEELNTFISTNMPESFFEFKNLLKKPSLYLEQQCSEEALPKDIEINSEESDTEFQLGKKIKYMKEELTDIEFQTLIDPPEKKIENLDDLQEEVIDSVNTVLKSMRHTGSDSRFFHTPSNTGPLSDFNNIWKPFDLMPTS